MAVQSIDHNQIAITINAHTEGLRRLGAMWTDPKVMFYNDPIDIVLRPSTLGIFLAGPTSRDGIPDYMWRKDAVHYLRESKYDGLIYVPEYRGSSFLSPHEHKGDFTDAESIYRWEHEGLHAAKYKVFWIPRNREQLLGMTTNREIGQWIGMAERNPSLRLFIGWPEDATKMGSLEFELRAGRVGMLNGHHYISLEDMCKGVATTYLLNNHNGE